MEKNEIYENCVYTIKHSEFIDGMIAGVNELKIEEPGKKWRSAERFLANAKIKSQKLYCVLCTAESIWFLYAYGEIDKIDVTEAGTVCYLKNIRYFEKRDIPKTKLQLLDGRNLSPTHIRTYVLCKTKSIEKYLE